MEIAYRCVDTAYVGLLELLHVFSTSKIEGIGLFTCIGCKWQGFGGRAEARAVTFWAQPGPKSWSAPSAATAEPVRHNGAVSGKTYNSEGVEEK